MNAQPSKMMQAALVIPSLRPFLSGAQLQVMGDACRGEEGDWFLQKFIELAALVEAMPATYNQESLGDLAVVHLHYFMCGSDWYITEKDIEGGIDQAFGYAVLNGDDDMAEVGYVSIRELTLFGAELDLHFTPCTLGAIKAMRAGRNVPEADAYNPNPWVVVEKAGTEEEDVFEDFRSFELAVAACNENGGMKNGFDVMKRLDDGTLTTEF
jgi:hypothetical protein